MRMRHITALASVLPLLLLLNNIGGAQINQRDLAVQLRGDEEARHLAFAKVQQLEVARITPELRTELISALEREGRLNEQQFRGEIGYLKYPELLSHMALLVIKFEDPRSIPGLVSALTSSPPAAHALARFGEPAALALLSRLRHETDSNVIRGGLISLRFMAEGVGRESITPSTRAAMIELARRLLSERQRFAGTVWFAIDLAVALDDPSLREAVEALAVDRDGRLARWYTDPRDVEGTRKRAADRLAGIPPLPRWKDWTK